MSERAKRIAIDWVTEHEKLLIDVHDKIWRWAEVGLQEVKTARLLTEILERHGFKVERGVAGMPSAFVATYGSGKPVIGIMGELDALPGLSQKAVPWREPIVEGGPGHGCGHHGYATAALGGALAAKAAMEEENLPGTIKCFGCPAEETLVGKVFMVRDGVFDGVDACLGHHPGSMNTARLGSGNAMNSVKFEFFGVAAHAAGSPHRGRSALDAVELMNIGVNYLREHIVQEARIHYVIEDGGHEPNVVPAYARSWYYIRAPTRDLVEEYYERVLRIADGADLMAGTTHKVRFLTGVHNGIPNRTLAELIVGNMREIGAPTYNEEELEFARELAKSIPRKQKMAMLRRLSELIPDAMELMDVDLNSRIYDPFGEGRKGGGSSDVADVAWNTPTQQFSTTMFIVGSPGHSWQNVASGGTSIGHKSSIFASKVMAATVIDLLTKPEVLRKAKEEWKRRMKGLTYKSPLPPDLKPPLDQLPPMPSEE
ncbi:amidohydrolase [Candidatus Bathyarchaeota archaeon]|nr:MAG: amidohydrolase [Candidatus Bathyarchaeota archaeon]RLI33469.1 MAG: amidohydrolase [Candidatus Bathyarchaeota archaeon]